MYLIFPSETVYNIFIGWLCIAGYKDEHWEYLSDDLLTLRSYAQCWSN